MFCSPVKEALDNQNKNKNKTTDGPCSEYVVDEERGIRSKDTTVMV